MIDVNNQAVKGVVVPSLEAGLELVGRGRVAALVGRLRDGAAVVDIDVPGDFGHWLAHEISGWLTERDCWALLRPSGGANGRFHVFCALLGDGGDRGAGLQAELRAFLDSLIAELRLRRGDLDLRDAVRPLSSPHRHGAVTRPKGDLRELARGLKRAFPDLPDSQPVGRRGRVTARTRAQAAREAARGNVVPLFPLQRPTRELAPAWRRYLTAGVRPDSDPGAAAGDRSLTEAGATLELVWAGHDAASAWQAIREAHPRAMTKARHQGWSWWVKYVWNPAVEDAGRFSPTNPPDDADTASAETPLEILAAVHAARERLQALMWTVPVRARPALLLVGHHLLDRMARTGRLRVPCPERDLVLDTGIADRKTIRRALRRLEGHLGVLHRDCLSALEKATTSFEFEINPAPEQGVQQIPPPSSHPPQPPRGLWATLPRPAHSSWRTLLAATEPLSLPDVAVNAGLTNDPGTTPSRSQLTTAKTALVALARAGLATVDEDGTWRCATRPRSVTVQERARAAHADLNDRVQAERAAYRSGETSTWAAGRARALKAQRAREKAWWDSLTPDTRSDRQTSCRQAFDQLSLSEQATLKARLADRRAVVGVDEVDQYQAWLTSLSPDDYLARSRERELRFAGLSPAERGASVDAWDRHRVRYGLTWQRGLRVDGRLGTAVLLPDTAAERDQRFLETQSSLLEVPGDARTGNADVQTG